MKISDIQDHPRTDLKERVTFILSDQDKRSLGLIAALKGRTISEVAREVIVDFLAGNQDELKKLG